MVDVQTLRPGSPLNLGPVKIDSRWYHHILPYGTIGLRISAGGKFFGYSGDTKYDELINSVLKRVESLQRSIPGKVLDYHTPFLENSPFDMVREGGGTYLRAPWKLNKSMFTVLSTLFSTVGGGPFTSRRLGKTGFAEVGVR